MDIFDKAWGVSMSFFAVLVVVLVILMLIAIIVGLLWIMVDVGIESYCRMLDSLSRVTEVTSCYH